MTGLLQVNYMLPIYKTKLYLYSPYDCNSRFLWFLYCLQFYLYYLYLIQEMLLTLIDPVNVPTTITLNTTIIF
jgi:hypothetical protein